MSKQKTNIQALMKQVQKVQANAQKIQEELASTEFEGSAGGGAILVTLSGNYEVKSVKISAEVMESQDKEMLEDLIKAALEDVLGRIAAKMREAMFETMGGAGMPGIPGLF